MSASSPRKAKPHKTVQAHAPVSTNAPAEVPQHVQAKVSSNVQAEISSNALPEISATLQADVSLNEKPVRYIIQNLERTYGVPENRRAADPLDMLIGIILSQATSDVNSHRTFAALKKRFPTWDAALRARTATIADTIRSGGLANQKAEVIKSVLRQIKDEHGTLDLNFLHDLAPEAAVDYLSQFRGIGPKTVACTLLFACRKDVFPLDTHIFRILRRVGLIPQKCTDKRARAIMDAVVPSGKFYSFHVNLIRHGRALCRPREPLCERCPIAEYCDYGRSLI
jgi:endonuclease-3